MPKKPDNRAVENSSRDRILEAALNEFAEKGLDGARVDSIAESAKISKQLIYYHFESKENLYVAALEAVFDHIRTAERNLDLSGLDPSAGISRFVEFTFDYVNEHREFVQMLMNENLQKAHYLKTSNKISSMRGPLFDLLGRLIDQGVESGDIKVRPDPVALYVTISSLCFFYSSNVHTLTVAFGIDFQSREVRTAFRSRIVNVVLASLASGALTDAG